MTYRWFWCSSYWAAAPSGYSIPCCSPEAGRPAGFSWLSSFPDTIKPDQASQAFAEACDREASEPAVVEYALIFPVLAVVLVLRSFLYEPFQIPSSSMVPTLEVGDYILVNKFSYGLRLPVTRTKILDVGEPERGDVMVFFPPHQNDTYYIKRVIGIPVTESLVNKQLLVNGEPVPQEWLAEFPSGRYTVKMGREALPGPTVI